MTIDKPEWLKERARLKSPLLKTAAVAGAEYRQRRDLIKKTVQAWYNVNPAYAMKMCNDLREMAKVENPNGEYKNKQGYVSMRLPLDLFGSLRKVFQVFAPDQEGFATTDEDIKILYKEFPKLMPGGFRGRSRKD